MKKLSSGNSGLVIEVISPRVREFGQLCALFPRSLTSHQHLGRKIYIPQRHSPKGIDPGGEASVEPERWQGGQVFWAMWMRFECGVRDGSRLEPWEAGGSYVMGHEGRE